MGTELEIPPPRGLKICSFRHSERRREARKKVAVVLAIGHALRAHQALSRPDALPGFLKVVHRLFEDGVFISHDWSIWVGILRSLDCFAFFRENPYMFRDVMVKLLLAELLPYTKLIADS
jgi:hypothetical protein